MLLLVRIDLLLAPVPPRSAATGGGDGVPADIAGALGADTLFGNVAVGTADVTALAQERGAIGIGVFEGVMVEDFAVFFLGADLAAAHAMSLDRVGVLHPIGDVQVVDVLLGDVIAAQPVEVVPIAHLELEFGLPFFARVDPDATVVPVGPNQVDVAEGAIVQALHGLQIARLVMTLQADADLQVFLLGLFGCGKNTADTRTIDGHGFLHEHVFTLADSLLEMLGAKSWGCC
ncbi:MAG: hypothetical protein RLZZ313_1132 [Verrucomicrobiota bacterium]